MRFVFVPITEGNGIYNTSGYIDGGERLFDREIPCVLGTFATECLDPDNPCFQLPTRLNGKPMHLDPDFLRLTYGDDAKRGRTVKELEEGDFLAFYASLCPVCEDHWEKLQNPRKGRLVYALIGLFVLSSKPRGVEQVSSRERALNAHTRWKTTNPGDIVAFGKEADSGLFDHCIPIGEWRAGAYRVRKALLDEWGDIVVNDGWIQRSANLPKFNDPGRFLEWLKKEKEEKRIQIHRAQYQAPAKCAI